LLFLLAKSRTSQKYRSPLSLKAEYQKKKNQQKKKAPRKGKKRRRRRRKV